MLVDEAEEAPSETEVVQEGQSFAEPDDAGADEAMPASEVEGDEARETPASAMLADEAEEAPSEPEAAPEEQSVTEPDDAVADKAVPAPEIVSFVPLLDLGKLPVELKCGLGSIHTNLGEIGLLKPGMIVDLKKDLSAPVAIFVNNKLVARGEPVKLGEGLGVRIVSLTEKN